MTCAAYAETYELRYTIGFDATSAVFHTYQGFGLPTHVFIDGDGVIRHLQYGPMDREQVAAVVEPSLATEPQSRPPSRAPSRPAPSAEPASSGDRIDSKRKRPRSPVSRPTGRRGSCESTIVQPSSAASAKSAALTRRS